MGSGYALAVPEAMAVGGRLELARIAAGLSRAELARAIGISRSTYERILDGSREPRRGELIAIAQVTGQSLEFFGASLDGDEARTLPQPLPVDQVDDVDGAVG